MLSERLKYTYAYQVYREKDKLLESFSKKLGIIKSSFEKKKSPKLHNKEVMSPKRKTQLSSSQWTRHS